jgi:hypothetical protein
VIHRLTAAMLVLVATLLAGTVLAGTVAATAAAATSSAGSGSSSAGSPGGTGSSSTASTAESHASYWLAASDGGVFAFGGLPFYGSMGGQHLNEPIVGMAPAPGGSGYWLVASDGGIFAFHAPFYGSMGGQRLNKPVVGMAVDPATGGYWLVASDGGVFAFHAPFYGSTGNIALNKPIVGMAATPDGDGYWLVASDGGIFTFGDAPFEGSLGGDPLSYPVVAMANTGVEATGYWLVNTNGAVSSFGTAGNFGSAPQQLSSPIVAIVDGPGTGAVTNTVAPSGSFGYDVSNYQCGSQLPSGHTIGIVQATGWGGSAPNPCLATEAAWAGGGLELYIFMADGTSDTNEPGCNSNPECNFGFAAAQSAFQYVASQQVDPDVAWWLDVEAANWSSDTAANDQVINGALIELRGLGINTVGIYTSPLTWSSIAGDYQPPVPIWLAWYTGQPQQNCTTGVSYAASHGDQLPTGGVLVTQYTDDANGTGVDGDYTC